MEPRLLGDEFTGFSTAEQAVVPTNDNSGESYVINRYNTKPTLGELKPGKYGVFRGTPGVKTVEIFDGIAISPSHALKRAQQREVSPGK